MNKIIVITFILAIIVIVSCENNNYGFLWTMFMRGMNYARQNVRVPAPVKETAAPIRLDWRSNGYFRYP